MPEYLVRLDGPKGEIYFWMPVGKEEKRRKKKPEPVKLSAWRRVLNRIMELRG